MSSDQQPAGAPTTVYRDSDFEFSLERRGKRTRAVFDFVAAPGDARLGRVVDYLCKAAVRPRDGGR